ncbi:MAG: GNAT family N-acetyltransferase [Clostridia bacterium]
MQYIKATKQNLSQIYSLVQETIKSVYPNYYPQTTVEFFCELHSEDNILKDIEAGNVYILLIDNTLVATGSYIDNHITRVYVLHNSRGKGYGRYVMDKLEESISYSYSTVYIDSSLPAALFYENRGYKTKKHHEYPLDNNVVLVYEIMEKSIE